MWISLIMLELERAQRLAELRRQLAPDRASPIPPRKDTSWRQRFAARLFALGLWLDPGAARTLLKRQPAAR